MKDRIAIVGRAATFTQLMDQAIAIDQRRRQSRRERKSTTSNSGFPSFSSGNKPLSALSHSRDHDPLTSLHRLSKPQFKSSQSGSTIKFNSNKSTFPSSQNSSASSSHPPEPSGPRGPLSEEEKTRRRQKGLCLYCGDPNHMRENCPRRLAREARISALPFIPPGPPEPENHQSQESYQSPKNYQRQAPPRSEA